MISRIEIVPKNKDSLYPSEVKLNGNKLECVKGIEYTNFAGEVSTATIEFGTPSIDGMADIKLEHPEVILRHCNTCDLVNELAKREGVVHKWVEPYQDENMQVNGPVRILTVID